MNQTEDKMMPIKPGQGLDGGSDSEFPWRVVADSINDVIGIQDGNGMLLCINPAVQRISGWPLEEILNQSTIDWVHPDDRFSFSRALASCKNQKENTGTNLECRLRCKSGVYLWAEINVTVVRNEAGEPLWLAFSARNITDRKNFELDLWRSEERFRSLIEKAPAGISIIRDGKILFLSNEGVKIFGYSDAAEILEKPLEALIAPASRPAVLAICEKKTKGPATVSEYDAFGIRKDGTEFCFHGSTVFVDLSDGPAILQFFKDISDRKQTEDALRKSEERLRLVLEGGGDGFFDWNVRTGHTAFSSVYAGMLGYGPEELDPHVRTWENMLHPEDAARVQKTLRDHLDGKTDFYEADMRLRTKSGPYKWIQARGQVFARDDRGNPLRMVGTHTDISKRKQLEEELRAAREDLEKKVAERTVELTETNTAMRVLLNHKESDRLNIEQNVAANVMGKILPHIGRLGNAGLDPNQSAAVRLLEEELREITSPFLKNLKTKYPGFTPQEIQVADLIRGNRTSKEIAGYLGIATKTVDLIRYRIRNKLKINNQKIHLGAYLSTI